MAVKEAAKNVAKNVILFLAKTLIVPIVIIFILLAAFFASAEEVSTNSGYFSGIVGDTIQEKVWWALKDLNLSDEQAAGVLGNIHHESGGFNAGIVELDNGIGIGLCQWSFGRRTQLESYAQHKESDWKDEDIQIEFLIGEMTEGGGADDYADYQFMGYNGWTVSDWKNAKTVEKATEAFCWTFERPDVSKANVSARITYAKQYYEEFHGKTKPAATSSGGITGQLTDGEAGTAGTYKSICSGKTYKLFYQNPPDNAGWYHDEGCWATCNAVIMSGFGWNGKPNQLSGWHLGSSAHYTSIGLKSATEYSVTVDGIVKCLKNGEGIHARIASGRTLTTYNGSHAFNHGDHSVTILDYRKVNGKYEFYVHDVFYGDNCYDWGDANTIIKAFKWFEHVWE